MNKFLEHIINRRIITKKELKVELNKLTSMNFTKRSWGDNWESKVNYLDSNKDKKIYQDQLQFFVDGKYYAFVYLFTGSKELRSKIKDRRKSDYPLYDKFYVGKTKKSPFKRKDNHEKNNKLTISKAIKCYEKIGSLEFEIVAITEGKTQWEAEENSIDIEEILINAGELITKYGWNDKSGGDGFPFSDEIKEKMSDIATEQWKDPEFRQKMSDIATEQWKDPNFKLNSPECREKKSKLAKKQWKDPKQKAKIKKGMNSPECKAKRLKTFRKTRINKEKIFYENILINLQSN